jgi:hypothetical protein
VPVDPAQSLARLDQHGPDAREDTALAPVLEVSMHGTVVAKLLGQLIPLAAGAQAENDTIEHPARRDAAKALGLGGVALVEDVLDSGPYLNGIKIGVTPCRSYIEAGYVVQETSSHQEDPMSHLTPTYAELIPLAATRSCRKARNPLIRRILELS